MVPVLITGPLQLLQSYVSALRQPIADVVGAIAVGGAVKLGAVTGGDYGDFIDGRQRLPNIAQDRTQTFFRERDPLPEVQGGRAIIKAVCQYAHDPPSDDKMEHEIIAELGQVQQAWRRR